MAPRITGMLLLLPALSYASVAGRSILLWQLEASDDVVADIRAHKDNITALSPCIYAFDGNGNFAHQDSYWKSISPYLSNYTDMGLDVIPLIGAQGGVGGMAKLGQKFVDEAIEEAVKMGYKGYNFDTEFRGSSTDASWAYLIPYAAPWMAFLNSFADALHSHNLTLSVDIAGCCGWVDTEDPKNPAGHCAGAFSKYEFVATHCAMYKESHIDQVHAMGTYSTMINGPNASGHYTAEKLFEMAAFAQQAIGLDKYSAGTKGGWPYCSNGTDPTTCKFDEAAKNNVRHLRDEMGVQHLAHWVDSVGHMPSQAQWDLFGFFLHDQLLGGSPALVV